MNPRVVCLALLSCAVTISHGCDLRQMIVCIEVYGTVATNLTCEPADQYVNCLTKACALHVPEATVNGIKSTLQSKGIKCSLSALNKTIGNVLEEEISAKEKVWSYLGCDAVTLKLCPPVLSGVAANSLTCSLVNTFVSCLNKACPGYLPEDTVIALNTTVQRNNLKCDLSALKRDEETISLLVTHDEFAEYLCNDTKLTRCTIHFGAAALRLACDEASRYVTCIIFACARVPEVPAIEIDIKMQSLDLKCGLMSYPVRRRASTGGSGTLRPAFGLFLTAASAIFTAMAVQTANSFHP